MKIILTQDVARVGKAGEIVEVADGYARNFLLPKKLAVVANKENEHQAKSKAATLAHRKAQANDEAQLMAKQLEKVSVTIPVKISETGKLYGSISGKDVADALEKEFKIQIDKRKISLPKKVTGLGDYDVVIKVHPEITSKIILHIVEP